MQRDLGKYIKKEKIGFAGKVLLMLVIPFCFIFLWAPERFESWADEKRFSLLSRFVSIVCKFEDDVGFTNIKKFGRGFWRSAKTPSITLPSVNEQQIIDISVDTITKTEKPANQEVSKKVQPPIKILIIGDSFVLEGFGPSLEKQLLKFQGVSVVRRGYYSTGLTRPDYFDWNAEVKKLLTQNSSNVVVVMFGANDGQTIVTESGKKEAMGTEGWKIEYTMRVDRFMSILEDYNTIVFWVGNPVAESDYYSNKMKIINDCVQSAVVKHKNVRFISTWDLMSGNDGKFAWYLPNENGIMQKMRAQDGIHLTVAGGIQMANYVINQMSELIELRDGN